jgi:hypothetical protein
MKQYIGKVLVIACILLFVYAFLSAFIKTAILKRSGICIEAVLISEMSSSTHRYTKASLMYQFTVEGEVYKGNSLVNDVSKVGDTVCVVYLKSFPSINRPLIFFDKNEVDCNCQSR